MKDNTKETKDTTINQTTDELINAVKIVQSAIKAKEDEYRKIASTEEQEPVLLEGYTKTGYFCHLMVDPKDVAQVFIDHDYAIWSTLLEEPPQAMWDRLAEIYGLDSVCSVDL